MQTLIDDSEVGAGLAAGMNEIAKDASLQQGVLYKLSQASGSEAGRHALTPKFLQDARDVDALTARIDAAVLDAVGVAQCEVLQFERLVDGRIEGNGDDQGSSGRINP